MNIEDEILKATNATHILKTESVQSLWSGYGEIKRFWLKDSAFASIIAKHIRWPDSQQHPRGWNTSLSHNRKLNSYKVERNFYEKFASKTNQNCRVPEIINIIEHDQETILLMEDLNESGFSARLTPGNVSLNDAKNCLSWLAHFHAIFMHQQASGLWPIGTYWHLDTRPDEWRQMDNHQLKHSAKAIDDKLNQAQFKTIVHGDAKLANFCFGEQNQVSAVDFQYVGNGCGMKDVAYCISSCFDEPECERYESELLTHYFDVLEKQMDQSIDFSALKKEWRQLYDFAWADFYRFLDGWSPGHWKMHRYSKTITERVIKTINEAK